jgi:dipeptidyl aminopeptidase/acylaminoacyl peptidase
MPKSRKRNIQAEDLYRLQQIAGCEISPDGHHVVYALNRVERKTEKKYCNLWVVPTDGGEPRQFTFGDQVDRNPKWSPDGSSIAFLSNRNDAKQFQIYLLPFNGGEAKPLTDMQGNFGAVKWSPDGKQLACEFQKKDQEVIDRKKDEQAKKLGVVARHCTRIFFKSDGLGYLPKERRHIWTINAETGRKKQLTTGEVCDEEDFAFSPDGKTLAFFSNRSQDPDLDIYAIDLCTIPARGGEISIIKTPKGPKGFISYSPDGKWLAYYGSEGGNKWWKLARLWIAPTSGKGRAKCLTAEFDLSISGSLINDVGGGSNQPAVWSNDSRKLYFNVPHYGRTTLNVLDIRSRVRYMQPVIDEEGFVGAFSLNSEQNSLAYFHGDFTDTGHIRCMDMSSGESRRLTNHNEQLMDQIKLGEIEEVWFKGKKGNELQGWILKPPGFRKDRKYPSILEIHGGPRAQYGESFMHEFQLLAANGYVVYFCNPRGSQGYGENHSKAIWNCWGTVDYDDVMAWAGYMKRRRYIDARRMGVTGGSYGGYMTNWIITHTNQFKVAATQRSVSNLISMVGSSDFNWVFQEEFGNLPPWENLANFWKQSPMKHIGNAKTPTLIIHSECDHRCNIEQGEQVYVALKQMGVDTEMVRFPDESHGLSRGGRTDRRIARLGHLLRWFDKYLK